MARVPACNKDAADLLRSFNLKPRKVAWVHSDAILWIDQDRSMKTTFVKVRIDSEEKVTGYNHHTVDGYPCLEEVA